MEERQGQAAATGGWLRRESSGVSWADEIGGGCIGRGSLALERNVM